VVIARGHSSGIAEALKIHSLKRGQMGYCGSAGLRRERLHKGLVLI